MTSVDTTSIRQKLQSMSPAKRKLLLESSKKRRSGSRDTIPKKPPRGQYALSSPQRRLWYLYRTHPESTMYNMPECARLRGNIDMDAFQGAFDDVVARHESLRVTFADSPDGPIQKVAKQLSIPIDVITVTGNNEEELEEAGRAKMFEIANSPFDLRTGPVVRLALVRLAPDHHFLIVNMHHIISDGWSMSIFVDDIAQFLDARINNRLPELEELPINFGDFVEWQNERLSGPMLEKQIEYWKPIVSEIESLQLPFDRPPTAQTTDGGGFELIEFDNDFTKQIHECSRRCGATLFMFLLAAFNVLLHYYTGQRSLTVGSPTAGRVRTETEQLIGFFANTLLITADVQPTSSFRQVVDSVKNSSVGAFVHDETPIEKLVEVLNVERDVGRNPLFQLMFILQNNRKPSLRLPGLTVELFSAGSHSVKFDMLMEFYETSRGIDGWLGYRTDLFDSATIARFVRNFHKLMHAVVEDPDQLVSELNLGEAVEQNDFNNDLASEF